jgi:lysophospholipid acyltransferase (LPLAT)-like uncharacterized protein
VKIEGWRARLLTAVGFRLFQLWVRSLRFQVDDRSGIVGKAHRGPFIATIWHNRLFLFPYAIHRFLPEAGGAALVSASRDGAIIADFMKRFGFGAVRGSSSRRGATALLALADVLAQGRDTAMIPDGPRGPAYHLHGGIIFLAQKSGADIWPMNFEFSRYWRLQSWDRLIIPKPFSRVRVIFGERYRVRQTASEEEFEAERQRLHDAMMALVEMR